MLDVSRVVLSPFAAQPVPFTVTRKTGAWVLGNFVSSSETLPMSGSIQPLNSRDLEQVPEGDRVTGMIKIYTTEPLYTTQEDDTVSGEDGMLSDEVTWKGQQWKILNIPGNFSDFGYYKSIATRKLGA